MKIQAYATEDWNLIYDSIPKGSLVEVEAIEGQPGRYKIVLPKEWAGKEVDEITGNVIILRTLEEGEEVAKLEPVIVNSKRVYDALEYTFGGFDFDQKAYSIKNILTTEKGKLGIHARVIRDDFTYIELMRAAFHGYKFEDPLYDVIRKTVHAYIHEGNPYVSEVERDELSRLIREAVEEYDKNKGVEKK